MSIFIYRNDSCQFFRVSRETNLLYCLLLFIILQLRTWLQIRVGLNANLASWAALERCWYFRRHYRINRKK